MHVRMVFLLASIPCVVAAGIENNGRGARPISLGNAYVAIADNSWATWYNPAGLAKVSTLEAAAFVVPDQFGLKELRTTSASFAIPLGVATAGCIAEQFGFNLYRETSFALGLGTRVADGCCLGVAINLCRVAIERYGSAASATIDLGVLADVQDDLHAGFAWKNVTAATVGGARDELPQIVSIGLGYDFTPSSLLTAELEKDIRFPFSAKIGFEQKVLSAISFRFGVSNHPDKFTLGFGAWYAGLQFLYAGYSHPQLGWTHQFELSVQLSP